MKVFLYKDNAEVLTQERFLQFAWTVRLNCFTVQPKNAVQLYPMIAFGDGIGD
jgi:hypothetical protein